MVLTACCSHAAAIDSIGQLRQQRPEQIDTSTRVKSATGAITVAYTVEADIVPLNLIHTWLVTLTDKHGLPIDGVEIQVSTTMPEHLHGMTTRPLVSATDARGQYLIGGMNFHMPGWWRVSLDLSGSVSRDFVRFNLLVGETSKVNPDDAQ